MSPKAVAISQSNLKNTSGTREREIANESIKSKSSLNKSDKGKSSQEVVSQQRMTFGDANQFTSVMKPMN